jgi:hypothetical protein
MPFKDWISWQDRIIMGPTWTSLEGCGIDRQNLAKSKTKNLVTVLEIDSIPDRTLQATTLLL